VDPVFGHNQSRQRIVDGVEGVVDTAVAAEGRIAVRFAAGDFEGRFGYRNSVAWVGEGVVVHVKLDWDLGEVVEVSCHMVRHRKNEAIATS
jgi:hypothetical protein